MFSDNIAIRVSNLSKCYYIYDQPQDRLKQYIIPRLQRLAGRQPKSYFREFWALKDVSFEVKKGETVGIIGRNGSGKSTVLQIICGILTPTSGTVVTNGRIAALLELGSGFNPEFTGRENVYMNGAVLGLSQEDIDAHFDDIAAFADIGEFIEQPVKTYSSGMYVRLAFAVAINVEPDILIVDEALAVGDASFQAKCMHKFEEFRQKGTTIVLVSHDLGLILQFSNKCILLDKGIKKEVSEPKIAVDVFKKLMLGMQNALIKDRSVVEERVIELREGEWCSKYVLNIEGCEIYGNSKVKILDFGIFDLNGNIIEQKLANGETYSFKMKLKFIEQVHNPIFSLTFRDLTGREIVGTNTKNEHVFVGVIPPDDLVEVSFTKILRLAPGSYLLTFACSGYDGDEFIVHERLYHILIIEIYSLKQIVGYYDMNAEIEIRHLGV